jgi:cellulose biosynthesis protein BcsQ
MAVVIAVACRKGGQGKTSLAASLAAASISRALHTATVDADSQANLSRWALGRAAVDSVGWLQTVAALEYPIPRLYADDYPPLRGVDTREKLLEVVLPTCVHTSELVPGLSVIPTANRIHAETAKELVIKPLPFDVVIVDTPPDISTHAVRSVLKQADVVISPVVCEPWAVDATESLVRELRSVGREDLIESGMVRFVINQRQNTSLQNKLEKAILEQWGRLVSSVVIPKTVAIAEASISPAVLTKKHPLFKAAAAILSDVERVAKRRAA